MSRIQKCVRNWRCEEWVSTVSLSTPAPPRLQVWLFPSLDVIYRVSVQQVAFCKTTFFGACFNSNTSPPPFLQSFMIMMFFFCFFILSPHSQCITGLWCLVCYAGTQLAIQLHLQRIQVVLITSFQTCGVTFWQIESSNGISLRKSQQFNACGFSEWVAPACPWCRLVQ